MFFKYCWKALVWAVIIFILSALPGKEIPEVDIRHVDKLVHFIMYGILSWLIITGLMKQTLLPSLRCFACSWSFVFCSIYGGMLELMQHYFITDRVGDWIDFFSNSMSAILVSILCAIKYKSL